MADNFNLRTFLSENKLTKNAQLLKEEVSLNGKPVDIRSIEIDGIDTSDYPDFVDAYITYAEYEDGTPLTEDELMKLEDENYGIVGELIFDRQLYLEEGIEEDLQEFSPYGSMAFSGEKQKEKEKAPLSSLEVGDLVYAQGVSGDNIVVKDKKKDGTVGIGNPHSDRISYHNGDKEVQVVKRAYLKEASYKTSANSKEAQYLKKGDIIGSGDEVVSVSAGAKTPSGKVEVTLKTKSGKTKVSTWGKSTKVGVKAKETVKENTMTNRERRLVEMVQTAMREDNGYATHDGSFGGDDSEENVDYTMGRHNDPNQLPNPAPELTIPEGEDMVEEKPLPKYENIEKLMQEIDKSTDEAAHKYKMEEMKRVADGLEKKATALEEGDNAEHIDQKKLKQMKKDIMSLRKGIEKMEKLGEKRFTKKETKESKPAESLAEGFFDLRKFLIENRKK